MRKCYCDTAFAIPCFPCEIREYIRQESVIAWFTGIDDDTFYPEEWYTSVVYVNKQRLGYADALPSYEVM